MVGCSTAAYFVRLHRARRRLERAMADPPESADLPESAGPSEPAGPPEPADSPDPARLGDPVLAHREEQAR